MVNATTAEVAALEEMHCNHQQDIDRSKDEESSQPLVVFKGLSAAQALLNTNFKGIEHVA